MTIKNTTSNRFSYRAWPLPIFASTLAEANSPTVSGLAHLLLKVAATGTVLMLLKLPAMAVNTTDHCQQPTYKGLRTGSLLLFQGVTGATVYSEHGIIEIKSSPYKFDFTTTHSNGFSREYIMIGKFAGVEDVDSVVLRKNSDFTEAEGPAPFIITPDLPSKYYYATNQPGQEKLHRFQMDDTWKLVGCGLLHIR